MTKPHNPFGEFEERWREEKRAWLRGSYTDEEIKPPSRQKLEPEPETPEPEINPLDWFSHALLVAAQGSGKTNLIRWRIQQLLPLIKEGKATLILLDPKDVLTRQLPTLVRKTGLESRTHLIDPLEAPVSFNLFEKGDGSRGATHATIRRLTRIMNTITLGLQPFQRDTLTLAINALFATSDNPTFEGLFPILRHGKSAIDTSKLHANDRDIFENDFKESDARYVITRLNTFRNNPYFEPLVSGSAPQLNLFQAIQEGKLILIKAGTEEPLYGKIWLEQINRVINARFDIPEDDRTPTFVIIDEAQIFIGEQDSEHFADILDRAREAKIGMFIACQHMNQIENVHTRSSLYNSAIKFIARTSADLTNLARAFPGEVDSNSFRKIPKYHFLFASSDSEEPEIVKLPLVQFPKWKWEDVHYFWRRPAQSEKQPTVPPATRPPGLDQDQPGTGLLRVEPPAPIGPVLAKPPKRRTLDRTPKM